MKRYLITGASGFVAFHFIEYINLIQNEDIEVLGMDINIPEDMENYNFEHLKLRFLKINLLDYHFLETAIVSFYPDFIVHLASFSSVNKSWETPIDSFINNTNIFLNLVEIIRKKKIKCRLLSVGSSEEYGNVPVDCIPIKETMPLHPLSPYAVARVSQEMLSRCYVSSYGLDIILTRSFNHIGPRQRDIFVIPSFVKRILECIKDGQSDIILYTGDTSIVRDFLDVRDVIKAYILLLKKGSSGELYNVCTGKGYALKKIIDILADLLQVSIQISVDSSKIRPNDNRIIVGDNTKIVEHTGWHPQFSLRESLQNLILYWKEELSIYEENDDKYVK
jgi:GDP-4-dehydro-6-deoxy-D-mannose reductase